MSKPTTGLRNKAELRCSKPNLMPDQKSAVWHEFWGEGWRLEASPVGRGIGGLSLNQKEPTSLYSLLFSILEETQVCQGL